MFKTFVKLLKAANANNHPGEIANAVACAMLLGFLPKSNLLWYIIAVFCLFLRINKGAFVIGTALFSMLAPLADSLFDAVGYAVLTFDPITPFFASLLEIPFVSFSRFNNTIVAGSLACSIVLYVPVYWLARGFIALWRRTLAPFLRSTKLAAALGKLPLLQKLGGLK